MANSCNLVNKNHYIGLKNFSRISEITYITETKQCHDFLTWNHNVNDSRILNNFADNLCSCLAKTYSEKRTNFYNSILKYFRLCAWNASIILLDFLHAHIFLLNFSKGIQGMNCDFLNCIKHLFKWCNSSKLKIICKEHSSDY